MKNRLQFPVVMIFLIAINFLTSCSVVWFEDVSEQSKDIGQTVYSFYSEKEEDCENPVVIRRIFNVDTYVTSDFFPEGDIASTKPGYILCGWKFYRKSILKSDKTSPMNVINSNGFVSAVKTGADFLDFVAVWKSESEVEYKVYHSFENTGGNYEIKAEATEIIIGEKGELTQAVALDVPGYNAKPFEQIELSLNMENSITIYYERKTINVTLDYNNDEAFSPVSVTGKYLDKITVENEPVKTDYFFDGWKNLKTGEIISNWNNLYYPSEDTVFVALWTNDFVTMIINVNDGVTADPAHTLTGKPGTSINISMPEKPGYVLSVWKYKFADGTEKKSKELKYFEDMDCTVDAIWIPESDFYQTVRYWKNDLDSVENYNVDNSSLDPSLTENITEKISDYIIYAKNHAPAGYEYYATSFKQIPGEADGIYFIELYYIKTVQINVYLNQNGSFVKDFSEALRKGDTWMYSPDAVKPGSVLTGWLAVCSVAESDIFTSLPSAVPEKDTTFYAIWDNKPQVIFDVTCKKEKIISGDGEGELIVDNENSGKRYADYIPGNLENQFNISYRGYKAPEVSLVYNKLNGIIEESLIYYRKEVKVTVKYENGDDDIEFTGKFGSAVPLVSEPVKTGFRFAGWKKEFIFGDGPITETVTEIYGTFENYDVTYQAIWNEVVIPGGGITDEMYGSYIVHASNEPAYEVSSKTGAEIVFRLTDSAGTEVTPTKWSIQPYFNGENIGSETSTENVIRYTVASGLPAGMKVQLAVFAEYDGTTYGGTFEFTIK